jgi:hypothetical protein
MKWKIGRCLALSAVLASSLGAAEPGSKVTVFVYNYADVPPEVLVLTEAEASRIYQQAGIEIQWLDCPLAPKDAGQFPACQVPPAPTRLALRILSQSMAERLRQAEDSFGFAMIPEDGSFAMVANVFSYDAEQLANRRDMRHGVILGHLTAHELGHLLLGVDSHSSTGIMHVPWYPKELDILAQGLMVFRPQEGEKMRTNIRARVATETDECQPQLTIKVYNYSPASSPTIGYAEAEAGRILLEAGIRVVWLNCRATSAEETTAPACQDESVKSPILRIAPHAVESLGTLLLGFTLPDPEGTIYATVVYSRVQELARNRVASERKILGYGIAHEIGHVLLGSKHSASGLMREQWSNSDWRLADVELLRFSQQEAIAMRSEVARRTNQITDKACSDGR